MKLTLQKRLASDVMGVSPKRITFDAARLADIKEAITKQDIRALIGDGTIKVSPAGGVSRVRANKNQAQRKKGLRRGAGSRKGRLTARTPSKRAWINRVRSQRKFLKRLTDNKVVTHDTYKDLYSRVGGGFFRSIQHIKIFLDEKNLVVKKAAATASASPAAKPAAKAKAKKQ